MSDKSRSTQAEVVSHLHGSLSAKLQNFATDVTGRILSVSTPPPSAKRYFEIAMDVLSPTIPDLDDDLEASEKDKEFSHYEEEIEKLCNRIRELEKDFEQKYKSMERAFEEKQFELTERLRELKEEHDACVANQTEMAQTITEKLERHEENQKRMERKFEEFELKLSDIESVNKKLELDHEKLQKSVKSNSKSILALKKLQLSFKTKYEAAAAPSGQASASSLLPPAIPSGPPEELRQKTTFSANVPGDARTPLIEDIKLLPTGLMVMCDWNNDCVKLFNTLGQHIQSAKLKGAPYGLTVIDVTTTDVYLVAVTLPADLTIALLEVTRQDIRVKNYIRTDIKYLTIASVDPQTLAVGCLFGSTVDIIDMTGRVIRKCTDSLECDWLMATTDHHLLCTTEDNTVAKVDAGNGLIKYNHKVQQIEQPMGLACHQDGSFTVTDRVNRSLHLVTPDGVWVKQLWAHPGGRDEQDVLLAVSVLNSVCVCCTETGSVFVFDVL